MSSANPEVDSEPHPKTYFSIPYSNLSPLNTLDIHIPHDIGDDINSKYWIIYIHGGAWRDPLITSQSILLTLPYLFSPASASAPLIAGVASINYRLSPYPSHPTDPSSPSDESRNVQHPAHIEDVLTAVKWLQRKYGFRERYLLVGHSCGATLAMQVAMNVWKAREEESEDHVSDPELPMAIVGVEGIYDLRLLRHTHPEHPAYQEFIEGAFGRRIWDQDEASPIIGKYGERWKNGRVVVVGHSRGDELVDWRQVESIQWRLSIELRVDRNDVVLELRGGHDEIWEEGKEMARAIEVTLKVLDGSK